MDKLIATLRGLGFWLTLLLIVACGGNSTQESTDEETVDEPAIEYIAKTKGTGLMSAPKSNANKVGELPYGAEVSVLDRDGEELSYQGEKGNWVHVRSGQKEGWVFSTALSETKPTDLEMSDLDDGKLTDMEEGDSTDAEESKTTKPAKSTGKTTLTKKPATSKTAKKPLAKTTTKTSPNKPKTTTTKTESTPSSNPTFSLVTSAKQSVSSLLTYQNDLEDMEMDASSLEPWNAKITSYLGQYAGPLGAELNNLQVSPAAVGRVNLTFSYQSEEVSDDGMIDDKEGDQRFTNLKLAGPTLSWTKAGKVYLTQGEFVKWTVGGKTYTGFIARGTARGKPEFVLLRKTK